MPAPGQSGNPLGRPVGARGRFSQQFISDLTNAWEQYGADALAQTAKLYPDRFAVSAPKDLSVSVTAQLPGNLDPSDWALLVEVIGAVRLIGSRLAAGFSERVQGGSAVIRRNLPTGQ